MGGESSYKLLDLIPNERDSPVKTEHGGGTGSTTSSSHGYSHDRKLELRLGLPGGDEEDNNYCLSKSNFHWPAPPPPSPWGYPKESSMVELPQPQPQEGCSPPDIKSKAFSPPPASTAVPNSAQKRAAPAPVVGWPPIRSFRKNLTSSAAAKSVPDPPTVKSNEKPTKMNCHKGLFVKINMEGVPIGRKVDLTAYDSYEKLSSAVDSLFRGLLAAQRESCCAGGTEKKQGETAITGLLDGSGEYTLVYEDNEGDRMLAGDVPWQMFVSNVKRLRVLKSSELSTLRRVQGKGGMLLNE